MAPYDLRLRHEENTPFRELLEQLVDEHRAMVIDGRIKLELGDGIPTGPLGDPGLEVLRIIGEALPTRVVTHTPTKCSCGFGGRELARRWA